MMMMMTMTMTMLRTHPPGLAAMRPVKQPPLAAWCAQRPLALLMCVGVVRRERPPPSCAVGAF